ncbi:MAG: ribonuclease HII [Desulfobacca sp.]|uniref:ribonuclease HII n=1 Tax=Desulfobacca sp. TaxID=2067990 RepID=UPI0040496213
MAALRSKARHPALLPLVTDPEAHFRQQGITWLAGVDEVGRGPLAGPVVAAAVILPAAARLPGLTDSKLLRAAQRESLDQQVRQQAVALAIAEIDVAEIESLGIGVASLRAMAQAVQALEPPPEMVLIDGPWRLPVALPQQPVVQGDRLCPSIAAASILAKVYRDRRMQEYHRLYPHYNFAGHKGYATREHLEAIRRWGPCPVHRRTFRGVREWCT